MSKRTKIITAPEPKYVAVLVFRDGRSAWTNIPGDKITEEILTAKCAEFGWNRTDIHRWRVEQDY